MIFREGVLATRPDDETTHEDAMTIPTTAERVYPIIAEVLCVDPEWIEPNAMLSDAPHADSLDVIELQMELEDKLHIALPDADMARVRSVEDLTKLVDRKLAERQPA